MTDDLPNIYLARHGQTSWSLSGRHTGLTNVPLTPVGERNAKSLGSVLRGIRFAGVFSSPLERARKTCELAGFGELAQIDEDLQEWDYGSYEGLRTAEIRRERPGWLVFRDGCPGGESPQEVGRRADRLLGRLAGLGGSVLVFSHGHFLRVLAARWLGLPVLVGRHLLLSAGALSILGYEHSRDEPAIKLWNRTDHLAESRPRFRRRKRALP